MNRHTLVSLVGTVLLLASPVVAQDIPPGPPPVLRITYEEIKPGSMGTHEKSVGSYLALFERAKLTNYRLGLVPVSGDTNQVVYLEGFESFAALETSYRPVKMDGVAKARYFTIATSRLKPGRGADYTEYVKQLNRAREKANVDDHIAVFQAQSGTPPGTFVTIFLNRSLSEVDEFRKGLDARNKAIDDALGGESVVRQRAERAEQIFAQGSGMSVLYSVNRKISRPLPQLAAFDAEFWTPKPAPAKAVATKKEEKKP